MIETIKKWPIDRIIAVLGFITTLGIGGYVKSIWAHSIEIGILEILKDPRSHLTHKIDSIANAKADEKISYVMHQVAEEELGKSVMSEALENFNGMSSEELKDELTEKFEFADKIMNAMDASGLEPEDMPRIYKGLKENKAMIVGPYVDQNNGAFMYRWYNGQSFPIRWGRPYEGLNNDIPYFTGPGGKIYSIPSMINNL